ncbi:DUF2380 domain-containing protein [Fulvimarina sp. 2208YS6-2-32]|uniref:DUF2380 domain-containing protein n=1 Tax=Fulvimarina uroteuthidis TaxID=3098149 RepID=A0ABU5I0X9_9HYPH|nr:DUF2380 domain-containing protein [Fulvimarina sp. 2208YS6-2-32]MDY8108777.1 DUF2380 domain-containing protein [Fulvimarina sp. 2208YS6-2-32]
MKTRASAWSIAAALAIAVAGQGGAAGAAEPMKLTVIGFDYSDSSGEPRDQTEEHEQRIKAFSEWLARDISRDERFEIVHLPCVERHNCTRETALAEDILSEARTAGADYLVFGGIHKMSTLVGGGRIDVLDVKEDRLVIDRVISFRGDNDAAFERAAEFAAKDIVKTLTNGDAAQARGAR